MPTVYQDLQRFAADPNLNEKLKLAFGSDYNVQTAQTIVGNWLIGDFSTIPPIELVERGDIAGANGAFAAATNKIYLSKDILTGETANTAAVKDVILEEIGHSIDTLVNAVDAPGDEGEIFADVVQEKTLGATDWANLKAEDDSTTINIDGKQYLAEMNTFAIQGSIGSYYYRSDNASMRTALGAATSNEFQVPNGWRQNFQNGVIFHSGAGSYTIRGSVGNYYLSLGAEKSQLGLPTSNEFQVPNGWRQNFQNGVIFHSGAGSYTVRGSLGNYYLNNLGGEKSQLGLPTGNEFQVSNGWRQNFERGQVNWLHTGSGTFTLNSSPTPNRLNQLGSKSSLTIDEIQEYRGLVTQRPQSERAGLYRTLQYKVPYFNQRDNASTERGKRIGDVMCNVTSLASCLTALGIKNPNPSKQFEDVLEDRLRANPSRYPSSGVFNARYIWDNLSQLARDLGVASSGTQYMQGFSSTNTTFFQNFVRNNWESALQQGKTIMAGVNTTQPGHIVKVIDIDWNRGGIVVDDPYGQAQNSSLNDYKRFNYTGTLNTTSRGSVNTQQGQNENGIGNDNFWSWSYCAEVFGDTWYLRLG
ncbi:C39 family peptidase [Microcoleus sp. AR_TQ3_B6]|uniref:C39 family peptidase n=1 Tax=Microcoleus sp. AR_TQ3_B6 TaxID=3055284 RepID=UPI002FD28A09